MSLPKFDLWFLSFFFLIPLLYLTEKSVFISPFRIFFVFSFFAHLIILYWIPEVMISYGGMNSAIGILGLILLSMYISFFYGLSGIFIKKALAINTFSPFLIPFIWISKDIIIENLFGGFPWSFLGYSQYKNIFFIQTAEIGGIHFITLLILTINLLIYLYIRDKDHKIILYLVILILFNYISGFFLLKNDEKINSMKKINHAGIIQPNTGQNFSSKIDWRKVTLDELLNDSARLKDKGAEFEIGRAHV